MRLKALIESLIDAEKEHGDIPVYVWADHGQMCLTVGNAGIGYIDDDGEEIHPDDLSDYDLSDLIVGVIIDG